MENTPIITPEPQSVAKEFSYNQNFTYAANLLVHQDKNTYEVKTALIARGVDGQEADIIIDNVTREITHAHKAKANKDMLWGAVWCIGGTIVTVASYSAASNGGGRYVMAWGAILFGGIQFVRGLIASTK